mgnify:CR=1 FL=1
MEIYLYKKSAADSIEPAARVSLYPLHDPLLGSESVREEMRFGLFWKRYVCKGGMVI